MRVGVLTISHRCEFEHCVQRALEIGQLIWKRGSSSPERCATSGLAGYSSFHLCFLLGPSTDVHMVFPTVVCSCERKINRAKESNTAAWEQGQDSLGKGGQSVSFP